MTDDWPLAAKLLAKLAIPSDRGVGDVLERHLDRYGGDRYKRLYKAMMGHDCGCANRRDKLNQKFPLP